MLNDIPDTRTSKEMNGAIFLMPDGDMADREIEQIDLDNEMQHESIDLSERRKSLPHASKSDSTSSSMDVPKRDPTVDMGTCIESLSLN